MELEYEWKCKQKWKCEKCTRFSPLDVTTSTVGIGDQSTTSCLMPVCMLYVEPTDFAVLPYSTGELVTGYRVLYFSTGTVQYIFVDCTEVHLVLLPGTVPGDMYCSMRYCEYLYWYCSIIHPHIRSTCTGTASMHRHVWYSAAHIRRCHITLGVRVLRCTWNVPRLWNTNCSVDGYENCHKYRYCPFSFSTYSARRHPVLCPYHFGEQLLSAITCIALCHTCS
jgi:hypothetical protein